MELGISPIVTSSMFLQLLVGLKLIEVNMGSKNDRELFQATQKLFGIIITLVQALAYLFTGMYGQVAELGAVNSVLIVFQLSTASLIVLLLDELIQKGYGLGSGVTLFIATNVCEVILWQSFSPIRIEQGTEFEGAVIAFFHFLLTKENKLNALYLGLFRPNAANISNLLTTIIVLLVVVYYQVSIIKIACVER